MKPAVISSMTRTGNLAGEAVTMTVDASAMEHIMMLLTDLYSDPELAVIREYSTNALDSHVEAGVTQPIEIFTPGPLSPFFKVKDYGIGLDADGIRDIYSKYGASTKRDTNEQVGMLGLGCKSALTYAPQFTLVGVKNGVKTVVAISRDERGRGNMEILEQLETDEPNGVEIMVPVSGRHEFNTKAERFFQFWTPGTVLVNGQQPKKPELTSVKDNVYIGDKSLGDYVVMGNVAYPVRDGALSNGGYYRDYSVVAYVNIGDVHFTPSREALHYTPTTDRTIEKIKSTVRQHLYDAVQREIETAPTAQSALEVYVRWLNILRRGNFMQKKIFWHGHEVTDVFESKNVFVYTVGERAGSYTPDNIQYRDLNNGTVIVNFPETALLPKHKSKIRSWSNGTNTYVRKVFVCAAKPGAPFTDHINVVDWKTIVDYKPDRKPRGPAAAKVTKWSIIDEYGYVRDDQLIDTSKAVYYVERARKQQFPRPSSAGLDNAQIVAVPKNRMANFIKMYPQAVELQSHLTALAKQALDKLLPTDYAKMKVQDRDMEVIKRLKPELIEDPDIIAVVNVAHGVNYSDNYKEFNKANARLGNFGFATVKIDVKESSVFNNKDYPLLAALSWWQLNDIGEQHVALYINAVYHSKKGS